MSTPEKSLIRSSVFNFLSILLIFNLGSSPHKYNLQVMGNAGALQSMSPPPGWYALPNYGLDNGVFAGKL
jgi:hypothetical protein